MEARKSFDMMKDADQSEVLLMGPVKGMMAAEHQELREQFQPYEMHSCDDPDELLERVGERIRVIVTNGPTGASAEVMKRLPHLESIVSFGSGIDRVDLEYAKAKGIRVSNTPSVLDDDVANLAIALLLASSRRIVAADRFVREGSWLNGGMEFTHGIRGKHVGIVGLGGIGKNIALKLEAFGCEVAYNGRREQAGVGYQYFSGLTEMARSCDYLILSCPSTAETYRFVNREVLDALGSEGTLINVARGTVVDEAALIEALQEGRLGGAALDVFENEPNVPEALLSMPQIILTPHVASATLETRTAMGRLMLKNLSLAFDKKPLATPVTL